MDGVSPVKLEDGGGVFDKDADAAVAEATLRWQRGSALMEERGGRMLRSPGVGVENGRSVDGWDGMGGKVDGWMGR